MAIFRVATPDPLSESQVVHLTHVVVSRAKRHRGVGRALIEAATDFTVECHLEHVMVGVYPSLREVSRFYARLGFAPAAAYRIAPVGVLRRRLGLERGTHTTGDAVRRRTRLRRPVPPQRRRRPAEHIEN
jgi:ribosomal protein S18 acetylase RimI-like enzyme